MKWWSGKQGGGWRGADASCVCMCSCLILNPKPYNLHNMVRGAQRGLGNSEEIQLGVVSELFLFPKKHFGAFS